MLTLDQAIRRVIDTDPQGQAVVDLAARGDRAAVLELAKKVRKVRTAAGAKRYGLPIGSPIGKKPPKPDSDAAAPSSTLSPEATSTPPAAAPKTSTTGKKKAAHTAPADPGADISTPHGLIAAVKAAPKNPSNTYGPDLEGQASQAMLKALQLAASTKHPHRIYKTPDGSLTITKVKGQPPPGTPYIQVRYTGKATKIDADGQQTDIPHDAVSGLVSPYLAGGPLSTPPLDPEPAAGVLVKPSGKSAAAKAATAAELEPLPDDDADAPAAPVAPSGGLTTQATLINPVPSDASDLPSLMVAAHQTDAWGQGWPVALQPDGPGKWTVGFSAAPGGYELHPDGTVVKIDQDYAETPLGHDGVDLLLASAAAKHGYTTPGDTSPSPPSSPATDPDPDDDGSVGALFEKLLKQGPSTPVPAVTQALAAKAKKAPAVKKTAGGPWVSEETATALQQAVTTSQPHYVPTPSGGKPGAATNVKPDGPHFEFDPDGNEYKIDESGARTLVDPDMAAAHIGAQFDKAAAGVGSAKVGQPKAQGAAVKPGWSAASGPDQDVLDRIAATEADGTLRSGLAGQKQVIQDVAQRPIPDTTLEAFQAYVLGGYTSMNQYFRGTHWAAGAKERADRLQQWMLGSAPQLREPVRVIRGVGGTHIPAENMTGRTFTQKGFVSTSFRDGVAESFAGGGYKPYPTIFDVTIPRGFRAAPVEAYAANSSSPGAESSTKQVTTVGEDELILPHGTRMVVAQDEIRTIGGVQVRYLRMLAQPPTPLSTQIGGNLLE